MITLEEVVPVGQFLKPHGVKGEISATVNVEDIEAFSAIICSMNGILVPFFISSSRSKSNVSVLLTLCDIDSDVKAKKFANKKIYVLKREFDEMGDEVYCDYFIGFSVYDCNNELLGEIVDVDDSTENALFILRRDDKEFFIPISEDFITDIDNDGKTINMDLPEGLVESQID